MSARGQLMDIPILVDVLSDFCGTSAEMIVVRVDGKLIIKLQPLLEEVIVFQTVKYSVLSATKRHLHMEGTKAHRAA